jgi:uncharacterized Zn-binding protein involved in type VI secretion
MLPIARTNDTCQVYCIICEVVMSGNIITGSPNVLANGFPVSNLYSIIQGACGHPGCLIPTTKNVANASPMSTMGSTVYGVINGSVLTGSPNVRSA